MLSRRHHLNKIRPSPTTVSYTVSTASPRITLPSLVLHAFLLIVRVLIGLLTLLILYTKAFGPLSSLLDYTSQQIDQYLWSRILPLSFVSLFLVFRRFHTGTAPIT